MKEPTYWQLSQETIGPGGLVAETRDALAGPGQYHVTVRRPGAPTGKALVQHAWPIELAGPTALLRFNPGMARWYGLRLVEAAAIYESRVLAGDQAAPENRTPETLRSLAITRLRDAARKVIDEQSAPAAMEFNQAKREAIAFGMLTAEDAHVEVLGYFSPNDQTILRGRVGDF